MISKQGDTLQGVSLTQGNIVRTDGTFKGATTFHCASDGDLTFTFVDGNTTTASFVAGDSFPFNAVSVTIDSGIFNIGYD